MLVLGRKPQQSLIIRVDGLSDIEVVVLHVDKEKALVRLGVKAPPQVTILRDELTRLGNGKKKTTGDGSIAALRLAVKTVSERRSDHSTG
jgi:carbon storage regulator CsrA